MTTRGEWEEAFEALGERLKIARSRRRWSRQALAERMGVSRQTVERLERGEPRIRMDILASALRALSMPTSALDAIADPAHDRVGLSLEIARSSRSRKPRGSPDDSDEFSL